MASLKCHNNYQSYVHWSEACLNLCSCKQITLFSCLRSVSRCMPFGSPVQHADQHRTVQCRYETEMFVIGVSHTFFFKSGTLPSCSSGPHKPLELSQYLRARPPQKLSAHAADGEGWVLQWSSPYPSSSSLSQHLTYQLSYRRERQDNWITANLTSTQMTIESEALSPGCRYEARVRARGKVGQWSDWSPLVTWQTENPRLQCVLDGEKEVTCSWEVRRDLAHFITYQLAYRHNHSAPSEIRCANSTVSADSRETMLRYSCSLTVPDPAHVLLELQPTRKAKTFRDSAQHCKSLSTLNRVTICIKGSRLTRGSKSLTVLGESLAPSQRYQVQVRSLVCSGDDYEGPPSEWTEPVEWNSHAGAFCRCMVCTLRKADLWEESVPSPDKSKVLSDIKVRADISAASLWAAKDSEKKGLELCEDQDCQDGDDSPSFVKEVNSSETSAMSFSGPYILCQVSRCKLRQCHYQGSGEGTLLGSSVPSSPEEFALSISGSSEGYVCMPSGSFSWSTEDLISRSHSNRATDEMADSSASQDPKLTEQSEKQDIQPDPSGSTPADKPPAYTPAPLAAWPQGGAPHNSGYCVLP
uniref:Fibronectin type-III domain-containing protein n=1 Tax=Myripristis murdjan TaxID=586833 RepID=A0A667Y8H3_9TELE